MANRFYLADILDRLVVTAQSPVLLTVRPFSRKCRDWLVMSAMGMAVERGYVELLSIS